MIDNLKIAVTGTFYTGKSSISHSLELLLGIPRVSYTRQDILTQVSISEKANDQQKIVDCFQICLTNFLNQSLSERQIKGSFITEDSLLHDYIYCLAILNSSSSFSIPLTAFTTKKAYSNILSALGATIEKYAIETYHSIIHLPVEFPVSKSFTDNHLDYIRKNCDEMLIRFIEKLGIKHYIVTGTPAERLKKILNIYDIVPDISIESALESIRE